MQRALADIPSPRIKPLVRDILHIKTSLNYLYVIDHGNRLRRTKRRCLNDNNKRLPYKEDQRRFLNDNNKRLPYKKDQRLPYKEDQKRFKKSSRQ